MMVEMPTRDEMRRALSFHCCPFCGAGPFKVVASHTAQAHAVSGSRLRELADLNRDHVLTDDVLHAYRSRLMCQRMADGDERQSAVDRLQKTWKPSPRRGEAREKSAIVARRTHAAHPEMAANLVQRLAQWRKENPEAYAAQLSENGKRVAAWSNANRVPRAKSVCATCGAMFLQRRPGVPQQHCSAMCYHISRIGSTSSDEAKKAISEANRKRWSDPAARAKQSEAVRAARRRAAS